MTNNTDKRIEIHEPESVEIQIDDTERPEDTDTAERLDEPTGNEEAKRYRLRLRDTEQQLEQTRADLDAANKLVLTVRREYIDDALARGRMQVNSTALEAAGHPLDSLFGDDGTLDQDKLTTAAREAMSKFGLEPARPRSSASSRINGDGLTPSGKTWHDALNQH